MQFRDFHHALDCLAQVVGCVAPDMARSWQGYVAGLCAHHGVERYPGQDASTSQPDRRAMAFKAIAKQFAIGVETGDWP